MCTFMGVHINSICVHLFWRNTNAFMNFLLEIKYSLMLWRPTLMELQFPYCAMSRLYFIFHIHTFCNVILLFLVIIIKKQRMEKLLTVSSALAMTTMPQGLEKIILLLEIILRVYTLLFFLI